MLESRLTACPVIWSERSAIVSHPASTLTIAGRHHGSLYAHHVRGQLLYSAGATERLPRSVAPSFLKGQASS